MHRPQLRATPTGHVPPGRLARLLRRNGGCTGGATLSAHSICESSSCFHTLKSQPPPVTAQCPALLDLTARTTRVSACLRLLLPPEALLPAGPGHTLGKRRIQRALWATVVTAFQGSGLCPPGPCWGRFPGLDPSSSPAWTQGQSPEGQSAELPDKENTGQGGQLTPSSCGLGPADLKPTAPAPQLSCACSASAQ